MSVVKGTVVTILDALLTSFVKLRLLNGKNVAIKEKLRLSM